MAVVICFQISIFELQKTARQIYTFIRKPVVICFQISIFELQKTAEGGGSPGGV